MKSKSTVSGKKRASGTVKKRAPRTKDTKESPREYARPAERGLGEDGGAWNLKQAAAWCGIGENYLRKMAKEGRIPCIYKLGRSGRRMIVPREGFKNWFNQHAPGASAA